MRTNLLRLLALCVMIVLSGCEKEATLTEEVAPKEIKTTFNDIAGVYEALSNDLFFISISDSGYVSYCLSELTMGHGNAELLDDDIFSVQNMYTEYTDKFTFEFSGSTLNIVGCIAEKTTGDTSDIKLTLQKVDEIQECNFVDKSWSVAATFNSIRSVYQLYFSGENTAMYLATTEGVITRQYNWHYIPRSHHERGDIIYSNTNIIGETSRVYCYRIHLQGISFD